MLTHPSHGNLDTYWIRRFSHAVKLLTQHIHQLLGLKTKIQIKQLLWAKTNKRNHVEQNET